MVPLIVTSGNAGSTNRQANNRDRPITDYIEIGRKLKADFVGADMLNGRWYAPLHRWEKKLKLDISLSLLAQQRSRQYTGLLSTSEKIAIPLSLLLQTVGSTIPHIVIAHKLSSGYKAPLFKLFPLHRKFTHVICLCRAQADHARYKLGLSADRVTFVHDKVDHRFFHPANNHDGGYVLAVGQEQRDYDTLARAARIAGAPLVIVASSLWMTDSEHAHKLPGVSRRSFIPYAELLDLYAGARLVVTPLHKVDYAAGVNALLEGMAMGKPVVVSRTPGITDYIVEGETGVFVPPGDVPALAETILDLWQRPSTRKRLGENARTAVETSMNIDIYVNQVAQIVRQNISF